MYHHLNLIILLVCYGVTIWGIIEKDQVRQIYALCFGICGVFLYPIIMEILVNIKAKICMCFSTHEQHEKLHTEAFKTKLPICYSDDYNITACGIEKCHPFDSCKYGRIFHQLEADHILEKELIHQPQLPPRETLLEVMSVCHLLGLNYSIYASYCIELPICFLPAELLRYRLLNPMLKATQGTIDGACLAIEYGWAINLSGGYHHASKSSGGGFCVYPDITMAVYHLRKWHPEYKNVMIIDLDAHQGNGYARDFMGDTNTFIIDCFNPDIYPQDHYAKKAIRNEIHAEYRMSDDEYINTVEVSIRESLRSFFPEFIIYNAGTDSMQGDPLGKLNISPDGIIRRDEMVFSIALENRIPILMVLSGGYQKSTAPVIAQSIENIFAKHNLLTKAKQKFEDKIVVV